MKTLNPIIATIVAAVTVVFTVATVWYFASGAPSNFAKVAEVAGQMGDSFGAATSMLTLLALFVLLNTFYLQKKELNRAIGFMAEQNKMGKKQLALNIIFQLCEQYREIMSGTTFRTPSGKGLLGREGLEAALACIKKEVFVYQQGSSPQFDYIHFTAGAQTHFSKYAMCFRLLHRIFKFIENETSKEDEASKEEARQEYARIPRAILSDTELEALLINCLTDRGIGMKHYVEKYAVFNNYIPIFLPKRVAVVLCRRYKPEAFGDNPFYAKAVKGEQPPE